MKNDLVIIAGCLVESDGRFLLVQEAQPKAYGLWNIPAGHVDSGEATEQAAIRETKEEAGLKVFIDRKLGQYITESKHEINVFLAHVVDGELRFPPDEILDARWFTREEIVALEGSGGLRGSFVVSAVDDYAKSISR